MSCSHRWCRGVTEVPKSLSSQAAIWLNYKHHNTFNFWIRIAPAGFILFLSSSYGGREQQTRLSSEIVTFMIYWKKMMK